MSSSPSSSVIEARKALADRLVALRKDAGLTGDELSARCGWHPAKTSRIQNGKSAPSEDDLRAWCTACGAADQVPDLIAAARAVDSMYTDWRRMERTGLRAAGTTSCRPGCSRVRRGICTMRCRGTGLCTWPVAVGLLLPRPGPGS